MYLIKLLTISFCSPDNADNKNHVILFGLFFQPKHHTVLAEDNQKANQNTHDNVLRGMNSHSVAAECGKQNHKYTDAHKPLAPFLPDGCTGIDGSTLHVVTAWKGITGSSGVWLDTKIQKERPIDTEDAFRCLIHHIGAGKVQELKAPARLLMHQYTRPL